MPFKDPEYAKLRPTLKLPTDQLKKVNDSIGLHPSLDGMAELLEDQALCIVQGVGYPNPSQSHFRSMDIWQAASTAQTLAEGWLGKALKKLPNAAGVPPVGRERKRPLALTGAPVRGAVDQLAGRLPAQDGRGQRSDKKQQRDIIEGSVQAKAKQDSLLDFVQRTAVNTYASSRRLQEIGTELSAQVAVPANARSPTI